jgi:hypothetical protein
MNVFISNYKLNSMVLVRERTIRAKESEHGKYIFE